jgi:hypothetical protein
MEPNIICNLKSEIDALDSEFRQALASVQTQIEPGKELTPY